MRGTSLRSVIDLYSDCGIRNISLGRKCQGTRAGLYSGTILRIPDPDEDGDSVPNAAGLLTRCKNAIETIPTLTVSFYERGGLGYGRARSCG